MGQIYEIIENEQIYTSHTLLQFFHSLLQDIKFERLTINKKMLYIIISFKSLFPFLELMTAFFHFGENNFVFYLLLSRYSLSLHFGNSGQYSSISTFTKTKNNFCSNCHFFIPSYLALLNL